MSPPSPATAGTDPGLDEVFDGVDGLLVFGVKEFIIVDTSAQGRRIGLDQRGPGG